VPAPAVKPADQKSSSGAGFSVAKTHIVTSGDTLWDLSGKYYHDPYKWGKIYNANIKILSKPDRIYPDQQLVIPGITEEVKPEVRKTAANRSGEAPLPGSETIQPVTSATPASAAAEAAPGTAVVAPSPQPKPVQPSVNEEMAEFESSDLSEEMPENQKDWTSAVKVVPDNWGGDGVIAATGKTGDDETGLLSVSGDIVEVSMSSQNPVKAGDFMGVYLLGSAAYDKAGVRIGREIQPVGMLEVLSADGRRVTASVVSATTAIESGYIVKKK
jgi:LysM repeat protein